MKLRNLAVSTVALSFLMLTQASHAQFLGTARTYGVLAGSAVTSTGDSVVNGDLGIWPGTALTGFPPGIVNGTLNINNAAAMQAQADLKTAYDSLAGEAFNQSLSGQDLGGMTLFAGVYNFSTSAFLTGTLTLDAQGDPDARFVFQIGSTLVTASNSFVDVINGGDFCDTYWQVGSSATLGTGTTFGGHILALSSITMTTGASIVGGSALARNGAVTMDTNTVTVCAVPEPATLVTFAGFLVYGTARRRRRRA